MNGKMYLEPTYLVYKPAEVIEKLGLGSTQGYEKINNLFVANTLPSCKNWKDLLYPKNPFLDTWRLSYDEFDKGKYDYLDGKFYDTAVIGSVLGLGRQKTYQIKKSLRNWKFISYCSCI